MDIVDAVKTAYERGLVGLCLTDHLDFDPPAGVADFTFDVPSQQTAIDEDVEFLGLNGRGGKYGDFQLLKGVEIGLQDKSMSTIRKILADNRFDCVIASLHLIDGHDPYFGDYYRPYDWRYAYGHYLEEFDRLIRVMPDFDILGHYDYIVRYPDYKEVTIYYSDFADVLDSILTFLVQNGKTLEINTKTYQLYRTIRTAAPVLWLFSIARRPYSFWALRAFFSAFSIALRTFSSSLLSLPMSRRYIMYWYSVRIFLYELSIWSTHLF